MPRIQGDASMKRAVKIAPMKKHVKKDVRIDAASIEVIEYIQTGNQKHLRFNANIEALSTN